MAQGAGHSRERLMRVAVISNSAFSAVTFRGPLIAYLVAQGQCVFALAPDFDADSKRAIEALGGIPVTIPMDRSGLRPHKEIGDILGLAATLRRLDLDLTFSAMAKPVIYGGIAASLARVPRHFAMIEGLGYVFDDRARSFGRRLLRTIAQNLYRLALGKARKVFFLNSSDRDEFVDRCLLPAGKAVVLGPIGLDLRKYRVAPPVTSPVRFLLVARLLRPKGIAEFVAAARIIRREHPATVFTIVGDTDVNPDSYSREEVAAWVAEGVIEWPGHVADVRPWLARASVFVLPSYREGVPRSTQEAMSMGRPVITTNAVGCRDTVCEGINGFLVPVGDADELAKAMLCFVDDPELITKMGAASRRLAEERYDAARINVRLSAELGLTRGSFRSVAGEDDADRPPQD